MKLGDEFLNTSDKINYLCYFPSKNVKTVDKWQGSELANIYDTKPTNVWCSREVWFPDNLSLLIRVLKQKLSKIILSGWFFFTLLRKWLITNHQIRWTVQVYPFISLFMIFSSAKSAIICLLLRFLIALMMLIVGMW